MASHHVLVLGGHGKVAQYLTPLLLQRSWTVTSLIRNPDQASTIQKLGENQKGKLNVLIRSLEEVKSDEQAKSILDEVKPDYVVWSAGAGGKGGYERTYAIDRDAATHFIRSAAATPSITKFLMVSYLDSRRQKPSWWSDEDWEDNIAVNNGVLAHYYKAKIVADEELYTASKNRPDFVGINLRPGRLTEEPAGPVDLGKINRSRSTGISRASVAEVAALLLDKDGVKNCWLDLLDGQENAAEAVDRCVRDNINCAEGEPFF